MRFNAEDLKVAMAVLTEKVDDAQMRGNKVSDETLKAVDTLKLALEDPDWVVYRP